MTGGAGRLGVAIFAFGLSGLTLGAGPAAAQQRLDSECVLATSGQLSALILRAPRLTNRFEVQSSQGCRVGFGGVFGNITYRGIRVLAQPRNGRVGTAGRSALVYIPRAGFRGVDRFTVVVEGERDQRPGRTVIEFEALVR